MNFLISQRNYPSKETVKEDLLINDVYLRPVEINSISDLAGVISNGYAVCPGLFDYEQGGTYLDNNNNYGIVDYNKFELKWKLLNHWTGGCCVFLDIDYCDITIEEYINNLQLKPNIGYYSYHGNPENPRFKLVYCFSEFLSRNKWRGAAEYLIKLAESDNYGILVDKASISGVQLMYGTTPEKLMYFNGSNFYNFSDLGCDEVVVDIVDKLDLIRAIREGWDKGNEFMDLILGRWEYEPGRYSPNIDRKLVQQRFYKDLNWILRTEYDDVPWSYFSYNGRLYKYKLIDRDNYLEIIPPRNRIQKGYRTKSLLSYAERIRLIKPGITAWEMMYSLILFRKLYVNYGYRDKNPIKRRTKSGQVYYEKDIIDVNKLIDIAATVLSESINTVTEHQKTWIERSKFRNEKVKKLFILDRQADYFVKDDDQWFRYFPDRNELMEVSRALRSKLINENLTEKLNEYYQNNPEATPISIVAEETGISKSKLYRNREMLPDEIERKQHTPHKLKITEEYWRDNYDPSLGVRENMRRMGIGKQTFYNAKDRWDGIKED